MARECFTNKALQPSDQDMVDAIGHPISTAWTELRRFLALTYEVEPLEGFGGGEWFLRYKRGSRPLTELAARQGGFRALVVLGKKEVEQVSACIGEFGSNVRRIFESTAQFHDGRWLWIMVEDEQTCQQDVRDIERLLLIKVHPPRKKAA